jgi:hypothetical protein
MRSSNYRPRTSKTTSSELRPTPEVKAITLTPAVRQAFVFEYREKETPQTLESFSDREIYDECGNPGDVLNGSRLEKCTSRMNRRG